MANALDLLRNMAKQPQTQESASRAINATYDFDSWRREDDTLRDLAMQRAIEENRRRYQEAVAPALESNRQRESFLRDYGMYPEEYDRMQSAKRQGTVGLLKDNTVRTNRERDALIQELKGLQLGGDTSDYAGWATDELSAAQIGTGTSRDKTARMQEIRNRLAELDLQLGNGEMSYGGDRLVDTVTGGAKGWAGDQATFFGKGAELLSRLGERLGGNTADYAGWATDELSASQIGTENDADKRLRQLAEARAMQETGRRWSETGASEIERAKNGLGQIGRLGVDLGANAVQMGLDAGTAALTGGSGALVPLFTRASGGGMREAEAAGADLKHQLLYGSTVGAAEAATEMLTGGLAKVYGAGGADELVERAVRKMTTSEVGRRALLTLSDMAGEGVEEIISDIVNPYAKALYDGGDALKKKFGSVEGFKEAVSEELYDGLVGALMGGFGSVTKTVSGDTARTVQRMGYADQAEGSLRSQWGTEGSAARDATDYAELIARAATGEELNAADRAKLESRPTAQNVLQEVTTQRKADVAQEEHALTGAKKERLHGNLQDALQSSMSDALEEGSSKVTESEAKALVLSYEAGTTDAETFYNGAVEAFRYGALGLSEHEARKAATFAGDLTTKQFQDAWKLGAMRQSGRADANTQEGRDSLTANLRFLGTHAQKAASAYEGTQSVKRYGEAMKKAVLYSSNGLDIREAAGQARDGERADIVSYLTDAQIQTAQEIGQAVAAERVQTVEQQVSRLADLRTRLTDALAGTPNLRAINSALRSANEYLPKAQADLDAAIRNMTDMQESGAWSEDEAAYQAAVQQVEDLDKQVRSVKESIREAEAAKAEEEKKQPTVKRKEGQVTYATEDGEASGVKYKAVDRSKLTRTQAATANVAEAIAKATGLEIRVVDMGKGIGGEYLRGSGGIVYLNINAAFDGKNISILSLSHELTHWLQEYAPKEYTELKRVVLDEMMKNPDSFEDIFGERSGDYSDITIDEITDEMVANACQTVLMDAEAVQRIVNEHRSLAERIRDFILRIVDDIKAAFSEIDVSTDRSIFREIHAAEGALDQIREIWLDAFGTATENFQAEQATINENTATEGGDVQYQRIRLSQDDLNEYVKTGNRKHTRDVKRRMTEAGDSPILTTEDAVGDFISEAIDGKREKVIKAYGKVNDRLSEIASKVTSGRLDLSGAYLELSADDLNHMSKHVDKELDERGVPLTRDELKKLPEYIDSFDDLIEVDYRKDGRAKMLLGKAINGHAIIVETISNERHSIHPKTAFKIPTSRYNAFWKTKAADRFFKSLADDAAHSGGKNQSAAENSIADSEEAVKGKQAQFQMISEVEETDRLVAVHNKSVSGLRRMLKRGGVPFPSIAIKRAGTAHQGFGDVSIVFPKSTIDPEVNRQNRLYSNDAWTPTEPRTEYEVDIPYKIKQRIEESVGSDLFTALNGYSYLDDGDVARALENSTGNLFEAMKGRRILKYAYLKSIGKEPEITQKEADLDGSHKYKNEQLLRIFEQIPADEIENANWDSDDTLKKIADVLNEQFLEKIQDPEKRERIRNSEKLMPYSADKISIGYIKSALFKYRQNGNRAGTEIDTYELDRVLRDNTEVERDPGYKAWIEKTFGKVIKNEGIPNGKDPYTSGGNRRSFKQTHVPATLENIVAQMQKEQERGIGLGGINLRGAATRTYKTVEEMRADRGRLLGERVSDDVYDSYMKGFYGRLHDMSDRVKNGSEISSYDSAEQILLEVLRDSTSKAQMGRKLQAESRWIRLYDGLTDDLWQLRQDVQNMPAPYFEAKPRRVVYPEEALAYIIPDSSEAADVREMLEEDGRYKVLTYKAGDEADRLRVLNSVEGAQFQRWDEPGAERIRPSMEEHHWGKNFPPVMYNTNLPGLNREGKALHEQAKNGDAEAARRIVARSVKPEKLSAFAKQHRGARLVAVRSEDGKNKIPYAYAAELAKYGLDIDDSIVQVAKAWHTGSNGIIRMIEHAGFDGDVKPGQEYILVDDVLTFGGTLNDLRMYIESKGGKVVACTTLAVGRNGHHLAIRPELVQQIYDKHGENIDTVLREEGIAYDVSSLTDRQGRYIRDLDVDTLRDRGAQERASEEYRGGKETGSRKEELTDAGSRQGAIQYQRYDDTFDDTKAERRGREEAYTRIQNENMILNSTIRELKKTVKGKDTSIEKILSKFVRAKRGDAEKLAKRIMREYSSKADTAEVTAAIKAVGDYYLQTPLGKLDEGKLKALARDAASLIAQGAEETIQSDDGTLSTIKSSLQGQKVYIKPEFLGELDGIGGLKGAKDSLFGKRVYLSSEAGEGRISVDQLYEQLHGDFGDYFFPEAGSDNGPANEGEEILIIMNVLDAAETMTVNPFDAYMSEAVEAIANNIAFRVMNDNVLRPMLPAEAEKALDDLEAAGAENAELRKKFDQATARGEILKDELEQLKQEGKLSKSELVELRDQVYDLTAALKKANNEYAILQKESEERIAQVREEGAAKVAQVRAKERERAAKQIQGLKDHYQEIQQKAKERREESASFRKYRDQVQKKAKDLYELLMTNSDKKHVPEVLKKPVAEFLESIDFTSKRQLRGGDETMADRDFGARMRALERALSGQQDYIDGTGEVQADLGGYVDISQENLQFLRDTIQMIDTALKDNQDFTINRMSGAQLKQLSNFLSNLNTAIRNMNNFMANARFESVREAASKDIESLKELGKADEKDSTAARRLLIWENGTPYYVFRRFGEGGKSIFDGFTKGWEKLAFNAQEVINFTEKLYTDKEVNEWKNDIKEITLSDGSKIRMTTAQIMELSVLLNREQARKHIEAGGIRIGDIDRGKGRTIHDTAHYHLTLKDIQDITGMLSSRQVEVAKALQKYMAGKGADWGNEISMRRFGYNFYTEGENYYPIRTDANDRPMADTDAQMNSMFRLLNLSSSKSLNPKASNALIVGNIFDTFADHMSDMAKLNGLGLPILDAIKWFNYKERVNYTDGTYDTTTMQAAMEEAYGQKALSYFRTLMKDINGMTESGDRGTNPTGRLMSNYKIAAVGANLRVALLQPTSYIRALTVLKPQYLAGVVPSLAAYREAMKYSGTAVWKSLGYYDTDIAKGLRGQIQHDDSLKDKIAEKSMVLAEKGDQLTWSRIWTACKRQAAAETGAKGEDLMQATADLFREAIYSSQVMDSTLTRSEIMRGKTMWSKMNSAFMAEPTLSYNILLDAYSEYRNDVRRHGKAGAWQRNSAKIGKALAVYMASATVSAIVESLTDAGRDDDDESYWDKVLEALLGEDSLLEGNLAQDLTIIGKVPFLKNFISTLQGYTSGDMSATAFNNAINAINIWKETAQLNLDFLPENWKLDKATKVTYYGKMTPWGKIYKTLQAVSQLSGIAASNLTRDATGIWNTIMNGRRDDWKIRTYDNVKERETGGFIKAILGGNTTKANEIMAKTESKDSLKSGVRSELKDQLLSGEIDQEGAAEVLRAAGYKEKEITNALNEWNVETDYGFKWSDRKEAYQNGEIDRNTMSTLLQEVGGKKAQDAEKQLDKWDFEIRNGWNPDNLKSLYIDGDITRQQALSGLQTIGGKSAEDAQKAIEDYDFEKAHGSEFDRYGLTVSQAKYYYNNPGVSGSVSLQGYADQVDQYGLDLVKAYHDEWKSTGITIDQYSTYKTGYSNCKGTDLDNDGKTDSGSKKAQVLQVIDALPVSNAVKDALYEKNGWSLKTIGDAPWRRR